MLDGWEVYSYAIIPSRPIVGTSNSIEILDYWIGFVIVSFNYKSWIIYFFCDRIWDVQLKRSQNKDYPSL